MNEESKYPSVEPELEARIVSLVLGEASDFEAEELNRLINQRPELAAFKLRMQTTHGLLQDAGAGEFEAPNGEWKLSDNKRNAVLAVIRGEGVIRPVSQDVGDTPQQHTAARRNWRWNLAKATAGVCAAGFVAVLAWPSLFSNESWIADRRSHWGFVSDEMPAVVEFDRADIRESLSGGTQLSFSEANKFNSYSSGTGGTANGNGGAGASANANANALGGNSYRAVTNGKGRQDASGWFEQDHKSAAEGTADALSAIRSTLGVQSNVSSPSLPGNVDFFDVSVDELQSEIVSGYGINSQDKPRSEVSRENEPLAAPLVVDGLARLDRNEGTWLYKELDKDGDGAGIDTLELPLNLSGAGDGIALGEAFDRPRARELSELAATIPELTGDAGIVGSFLWDEQHANDGKNADFGRLFGRLKVSELGDDLALVSPKIIIADEDEENLNGVMGDADVDRRLVNPEFAGQDEKSTESLSFEKRDFGLDAKQQKPGGQQADFVDRSRSEGEASSREYSNGRWAMPGNQNVDTPVIVDEEFEHEAKREWGGKEFRLPETLIEEAEKIGVVDGRFGNAERWRKDSEGAATIVPDFGEAVEGVDHLFGDNQPSRRKFNSGNGAADGEKLGRGALPTESHFQTEKFEGIRGLTPAADGFIADQKSDSAAKAKVATGNVSGGFSGGGGILHGNGGMGGGGRGLAGLAELSLSNKERWKSLPIEMPVTDGGTGLGVQRGEPSSGRSTTVAPDETDASGHAAGLVVTDGDAPDAALGNLDFITRSPSNRPEVLSEKRGATMEEFGVVTKNSKANSPPAVYSGVGRYTVPTPVTGTPAMPALSGLSASPYPMHPPQPEMARPGSSVDGPGPGLLADLSIRFERNGRDKQVPAVPEDGAEPELMKRGRSRLPGSDFSEALTLKLHDIVDSEQQEKKLEEAAPAAQELIRRGQSRISGSSVLEGVTVDIARGFKQSGSQQRESEKLLSDLQSNRLGIIRLSEYKRRPATDRVAASAELNEKNTVDEAFSTFSLHVSDVSFKLAFAALSRGEWPEAAKVRIEEFVNAFDYGDPMPCHDEKVACAIEQSIHPFVQQRNLLRVSMKTAAAGRASKTPLRLTFLLDNSGSMERIDRQQTVRRAFALLAQQLKPIDQVTLISFARQPRLLADKVSGSKANKLVGLIDELPSEGGTNIESALQLAFEKAREQQTPNAQNRIILLTDGAVNLGNANPESLSQMVTRIRSTGIAFDAAGISAEGLNDEVLEALTRQGDGRYYLLDSIESADGSFASQIAGALRPSAKNVKVQVEFNPKRVGHYKLLGFEKHILKKEDFRNDSVDAAEMAAAEAGVAMYQFEAMPDGEGDVGSVSVRFRDLSTGQMVENRWPIPYEADAPRSDQAAPSLRIAASAALLAAKLKGQPLGESVDLRALSHLTAGLPETDRNDKRVQQLQQMIEQARQLSEK